MDRRRKSAGLWSPEGNETVTNCHQLKMMSADGKQRNTDVTDLEQLDKPASQKYWDPKDLTNQWKAHNVQEGVGHATE